MKLSKFSRRFFCQATLALLAATTFTIAVPSRVNADEPEYQAISDIVYKQVGDRKITLNLFMPVKDGQIVKGRPLLIYLDSGCWYSGEPGNGGVWTDLGARERGFAIASVSHRPINEAQFPAPMEDVRAAVRFLRKHASEYGYDPDRFAVCGCSSGGNLSLSLGISDEKSPFNVGDNLDVSGQVQVVVDFFGPSDFKDVFTRYPNQAIDCIYDACGFKRDAAKPDDPNHAALMEKAVFYSPITYVDENYAPTILLQGTVDPLVPLSQSALMFEKIAVHGVRSRIVVTNGGVHNPGTLGSRDDRIREIFDFLEWK